MEEQILTVTQCNSLVKDVLSELRIWVQGEISGYKISQNKWVTFDLKDEGSKINCFMTIYQLDQVLEDGMEIKMYGTPSVYVPYGKYSFTVQKVEPVGEGALRKAFELTKRKLQEEGIFSPEQKKAIPRFPQKVGIITSEEAAAYTDFQRIVNNRWSGVEMTLRPSLVQGVNAPGQLVQAIEWFNKHYPVDVIVMTRGGGSLEDLQAFNSEQVCRAIYASNIPIVCGVGHERDTTLAELSADKRASTPSNAAEIVVPDKQDILAHLERSKQQMQDILLSEVERYQWKVNEYGTRMGILMQAKTAKFTEMEHALERAFQSYRSQLAVYTSRLTQIKKSLRESMKSKQQTLKQDIAQMNKLLASYNPQNVLKRGYAIPRNAQGALITSAKKLKKGDYLQTEFADGVVASTVESKSKTIRKTDTLL